MHRTEYYVPDQTPWPVTDELLVLKKAHSRRIWLLTIRHTGTHYMFRVLEQLGFFQGRPDFRNRILKNHRVAPYFIHSHIETASTMQYVCDDPVVMTMRNPVAVYISHLNRYPWHEGFHIEYIQDCYERFEAVCARYNPFLYRVDKPDQESEVRRLTDWLGCKYKYRELPKDVYHDGRVRLVNQEPPKEILELANKYGY